MLVHQLLERAARRTPDAAAVLEPAASVTYRELDALANRVAHLCRRRGVRPRDRVVLASQNSIAFVAAYVGIMKAGATAVPLPAGPRNDQLAPAIVSCRPALALVDRGTARVMERQPGMPAVPIDVLPGGDDDANTAPLDASTAAAPADAGIGADWLAAIIYTSGSTGTPRGVMLTHRNIVANTRSIVGSLGLTASDRVMCVLPFHYVYGLSLLHTHLMVGGSIVLDNRFAYPNVVLGEMRRRRVTGLAGVPSTFALLLQRSDLPATSFPDLRYVTQAGGPMPSTHIQEWREHGPPVPFFVMYGATEASARLTCLPPHDLARKPGSIGVPIPGVTIEIVTDEGGTARPGEIGELVARGDNISPGYWGEPEETRARFGRRGYRTGDLGYADDEGYLFLVGRRHDMLKVGGRRVCAREIEDVVHRHPGVGEAAVVGAPNDILGEVPVAFVARRRDSAPVDEQSIRAFCTARLPAYKVPAAVVFTAGLPLRPGGKIDKVALQARARAMTDPWRSS